MRLLVLALGLALGACGGGDAAPAADCGQLALDECRVTAGCKADVCDGCTCTPQFRGCVAASATPAACPALGCPSPQCCGATDTCTGGTRCLRPGESPGCGACNPAPSECSNDPQCGGAPQICEPLACSCSGGNACVPGCVDDTTCGPGTRCVRATGRCAPAACDAGTPCPANFSCTAGQCERTPCTDDLPCAGYCVLGTCEGERGRCLAPPP